MRTFRIDAFTKKFENEVEKQTASIYFSEAATFLGKAFGINCRFTTQTRVEDDGEIECLVTIEGSCAGEEEDAVRLFEEFLIERTDRFSVPLYKED